MRPWADRIPWGYVGACMRTLLTRSGRRWDVAARSTSVLLFSLLISAWAVMPVVLHLSGRFPTADVARLVEIQRAPGILYRDFAVEYPPLLTLIAVVLFRSHLVGEIAMVTVNAASVVGTFVILQGGWSRSAANVFLLLSLPVQLFMPFELDALTAMLAVGGLLLARRRKDVMGGAALGAAVLLKIWPRAASGDAETTTLDRRGRSPRRRNPRMADAGRRSRTPSGDDVPGCHWAGTSKAQWVRCCPRSQPSLTQVSLARNRTRAVRRSGASPRPGSDADLRRGTVPKDHPTSVTPTCEQPSPPRHLWKGAVTPPTWRP